MARTVFGNHDRYVDTYLTPYKGLYFTGDGVFRDKEGYYWIRGRVDGTRRFIMVLLTLNAGVFFLISANFFGARGVY